MPNKRRIFDQELHCHFVTFNCHQGRRLLDQDQPKRILLGHLNDQMARQEAKCAGFVIMPDHVHAMLWFSQPQQLSRFMHGWKRLSSFAISRWYREQNSPYLKHIEGGDPFWKAKYFSFEIYSRQKMEEKLSYMHLNPVRAALVKQAVDYRWSSARWYEERKSVGVPISWIE